MAFREIKYLGQYSARSQIRENMIWRLREAFTNIGGYYNISSGTYSYNGVTDMAILKPAFRSEISSTSTGYKFWQGVSPDWVWETVSPEYTGGTDRILVSGIHINGQFYPTGTTGQYSFYVDYARGGVVFNNELNAATQIYCNRSERAVFIYPTKSANYKTIFVEHLKRFENYVPGSGNDALPTELRSFLPAVFVDVTQSNAEPFQLGDITNMQHYTVLLDVIAEDPALHDTLVDSALSLASQGIKMFDVNQVVQNKQLPLNYKGELENATTSDALYASYPWKTGRFDNNPIEIEGYTALPLYKSTVTIDFEIVL